MRLCGLFFLFVFCHYQSEIIAIRCRLLSGLYLMLLYSSNYPVYANSVFGSCTACNTNGRKSIRFTGSHKQFSTSVCKSSIAHSNNAITNRVVESPHYYNLISVLKV